MHIKFLGHFQLWTPQSPQFNSETIRKDGPPFQSFGGPELVSEVPEHIGQFGHDHYPWPPGDPFKIGPRGTSISPTYHGVQAMGHKNQN
ncbi:hypothetical protein O181_047471 [Austropuccinia psidii MF-1]|uniref:Uncharacterized protein n=1 Tax=Austropuccinia psidii MF-1 TaxID=1389203 RepID=A0A9Q3DW48_9BASI|nr:hypothetical protein [Austropuccinia psidii MF-1]